MCDSLMILERAVLKKIEHIKNIYNYLNKDPMYVGHVILIIFELNF